MGATRMRGIRRMSGWGGAWLMAGLATACGGGDGPAAPDDETPDAPPGSWRAAAPLPQPVSGAGAAVYRGRIWVVGGRVPGGTDASAAAFRYDPGVDAWERLPDLPAMLWRPGVAVAGDTLLVVGGNLKTDALAPTSDVYRWDDSSRSWVHHGRLPVPSVRPLAAGSDAGVLAIGLGGAAVPPGDSSAFLARAATQWRWAAPAPVPSEALLGEAQAVWAVGGGRLARFSPAAANWSDTEVLPQSGFLVGAWLRGGRLHVALRAGDVVDHLVREDANRWALRAPPPASTQRNDALALTLGGRLYLVGGSDNTLGPLTRVDVYEEPPG